MGICREARRLPRDPGPAAWNEILEPALSHPVLAGDITTDWLIIGAGFAGLSAARRLSQLRGGDKITVIEACRIGHGPAGRNSGFMIDLPHDLSSDHYTSSLDRDHWQIKLNRQAISFAREVAEDYDLPQEAADPCGRINGAVTAAGIAHNTDYAAHLERLGEPFETLDADAMYEITGSRFYAHGLYMPGCMLLQPALYIRGLATGLAASVDIFEQTPALRFERQQQEWCVTTKAGRITTPRIILAVNGHAESFGYFSRRLMHVFTYASMTEPLDGAQLKRLGGNPRWGITPADPMGSTVRRISGIGGDRIVIRNRWSFNPSMEVSDARVERYGRDQDKGFARRFPRLGDVKMAYRWGGRLCLSRNSAPAFGEIEEGIFSACCQNGLGTAKGTLAGIAAAELATRSNSPVVDDMLAAPMPQRLPPEPFATLGASLVIKWREWKGRAEI
ncbi:NAD(P)/FAD-dependent oxidoreductase [Alphaproteobacteria bacterium LSUCC0684]